ncbi:hypothetical protein EIP91_003925 [Steccherinum ochraceum]|uniref:Uncharacterized protein n=1 Tax=Steccherinum ochraceum TaxID=92696 RepID=A0A4R0RR81_9APHY|nr:hypothetical protein EIP91_003925 [Steccherinum ochraceum]
MSLNSECTEEARRGRSVVGPARIPDLRAYVRNGSRLGAASSFDGLERVLGPPYALLYPRTHIQKLDILAIIARFCSAFCVGITELLACYPRMATDLQTTFLRTVLINSFGQSFGFGRQPARPGRQPDREDQELNLTRNSFVAIFLRYVARFGCKNWTWILASTGILSNSAINLPLVCIPTPPASTITEAKYCIGFKPTSNLRRPDASA